MNIVNGIQNIKGKTSVNILVSNYKNILVSNYTSKHIMFHKGEYVGHLELTIEDIEEEKICMFMLNQMPIPLMVLQPNE